MAPEAVLHEYDGLRMVQRSMLGRCVLSFHGPITFKARRPFQDAIAKLRAEGCPSLALHLREVPFVDSVALALITITWRTWSDGGFKVVIAEPSPYVEELLNLANITKLVSTFDSLQDAIAFLNGSDPPIS